MTRSTPHYPFGQVRAWPYGHTAVVRSSVFPARLPVALDRCEHCGAQVDRVWLVPGDVLDSCRACYTSATGVEPVHAQGHSTERRSRHTPAPRSSAAAFYLRADGRRPA